MHNDHALQADVHRLNEMIERCEEKLLAQRVCVLKPTFVSCTLAAALAGTKVKLKCRSSATTVMKSGVYHVPAGGGKLGLLQPAGAALYEGDDALRFELCHAHRFRPSTVLATGSLPLADVFGAAGLEGDGAPWTVQLTSKDARVLGSLEVCIRCETGSLDLHGGTQALKVLALAARPGLVSMAMGGQALHVATLRVWEYNISCCKAALQLEAAFDTATKLAGTSDFVLPRCPTVS